MIIGITDVRAVPTTATARAEHARGTDAGSTLTDFPRQPARLPIGRMLSRAHIVRADRILAGVRRWRTAVSPTPYLAPTAVVRGAAIRPCRTPPWLTTPPRSTRPAQADLGVRALPATATLDTAGAIPTVTIGGAQDALALMVAADLIGPALRHTDATLAAFAIIAVGVDGALVGNRDADPALAQLPGRAVRAGGARRRWGRAALPTAATGRLAGLLPTALGTGGRYLAGAWCIPLRVLPFPMAIAFALASGGRRGSWSGKQPSPNEGTAEGSKHPPAACPLGHGTRQLVEPFLLHGDPPRPPWRRKVVIAHRLRRLPLVSPW